MVTKLYESSSFAALADPTRRAILDLLRVEPIAAGDIAAHFPVSRPAISKHVRILKQAGLVTERVDGRNRYYALAPTGLATVDQWLQPYRAFWAARLVTLKHMIEEENGNGGL